MTAPEARKLTLYRLFPALVVAFATLSLFLPSCRYPFVNWDDNTNTYQNPYLNPTVTASGIAHLWAHPYNDLYTPVTSTIWGMLASIARLPQPVKVFGGDSGTLDAAPFHTAGVIVHVLNAVLVYLLLERILRAMDRIPAATPIAAALGALLFAVHPLQVEAVAWVTGHNNVYSGFFTLVALLLYLRYATAERTRATALWYFLATLAFVLALLSKPTAVATPLLAATLDALLLRRSLRAWLPGLALWSALALACLLLTHSSSTSSVGVSVPLLARPLLALDALAFYLYKLIIPLPLTLDYGRTPEYVLAHGWAYANALAVIALTGGLIALYARRGVRWPLVALLLFVSGVLPMLGLVPFYFEKYSTVADRYLYLSLLGPALVVAVVCSNYSLPRPLLIRAGFIVAILLYGLAASFQVAVWRDSVALFEHATAVNPESAPMWHNLGNALPDRNEPGDLQRAEAAERNALRLRPDYAEAHFQLGQILEQSVRPSEAIAEFAEATRYNRDFYLAWFREGVALAEMGRSDEAITAMARAAELRPNDSGTRYIYGVLLANAHRNAEAEREFRAALKLKPDYAEAHYNLGAVLDRQGELSEAIPEYEEAIRLSPENPAPRAALAAARRRLPTGSGR